MRTGNAVGWLKWGAVAAPVVLIAALTVVNRLSGPSQARAERGGSEGAESAKPEQVETVVKVEEWMDQHRAPVSSPFEASRVEVQETTAPETFEGVRLTGVFRTNDTAIAAINGKLVREGQEVRRGVRVKSIDARGRKVILILDDGREIEISPGNTGKNDKVDGTVRAGT